MYGNKFYFIKFWAQLLNYDIIFCMEKSDNQTSSRCINSMENHRFHLHLISSQIVTFNGGIYKAEELSSKIQSNHIKARNNF